MARARNIKPSIYRNEVLGTLDPLVTILFTSLWCLADRDGKLEDRPLRIKADTFPYRENIDINGYLTVLAQHGFIRRYVVGDLAVIQVCKFKEHQSPHKTERDSVLPDEPSQVIENKQEITVTVIAPLANDGLTAALPPESIFLIPDSLIPDSLIPDSLIPDSKKRGSAVAPYLAGIPENLLADFLKVRKAKRAGELTETALRGIEREGAKAGLNAVEAITACVEYGWQGFNAGWYADRHKTRASGSANTTAKYAGAAAAIFQMDEEIIDV